MAEKHTVALTNEPTVEICKANNCFKITIISKQKMYYERVTLLSPSDF
jgi:hypothetical protein